ncbi:MAG: dienelactone hydrolase family protein, partial [Chitinispirillaceae bacterium]|nr:dienelactone hydrolase family protein [Chitinispirillaceae bacterium]
MYRLLSAMVSLVFVWSAFGQFERATITINGTEREYHIHAPSNLTGNPPLVFAAHGAAQYAKFMMDVSGWDEIADREKLVVVYPQGQIMNVLGAMQPGWDLANNGKDVQFFLAIIDSMAKRYDIDRYRVYETGFSMGGMLGYTLACAAADKFAAIAPCSGFPMGGVRDCAPERNIPILHMHGANDDFVPYSRVRDEILAHFVDRYNCPGSSEITSNYNGVSKLTKETWSPCDS